MKTKSKDIFELATNKWVFLVVLTVMLFCINLQLSKSFFTLQEYIIVVMDKPYELIMTAAGMRVLKRWYILVTLAGLFCISIMFYSVCLERFIFRIPKTLHVDEDDVIIPDFPWNSNVLQIIVGLKHEKFTLDKVKEPEYLVIPEAALFQNLLITGTIGMGKTASVMYPILKQALFYKANEAEKKAGMLVLDVKGNFYRKLLEFAQECGRADDVVVIHIDGDQRYNPLHKPEMEAIDIAERSRCVLDLFSAGAKKEAFWNTKSSQMMTECIRLMRLTNHGYVSLADVHALVTDQNFLEGQLELLYDMEDQVSEFEFRACTNYFLSEFNSKAETTIATIKSCVTEMTGFFASSEKVNRTFCPSEDELNFAGFQQVLNEGKIVVLAMNLAKYPKVAKTIAAYLKLDFQSEVEQRVEPNSGLNRDRPVFFISDEYQSYVTTNDAAFYGLSRESRCCSIVSSQSYTSILETLGRKESFEVLHQNLVNKIWLRTDDELTVKVAQFLTGKEEKERYSKNISESTNDAKKSKVFGKLTGEKSSISESVNLTTQRDFVFEERIFTQTLELFKAVAFTANENGMNEPYIVHLLPYFQDPILTGVCVGLEGEEGDEKQAAPILISFTRRKEVFENEQFEQEQ